MMRLTNSQFDGIEKYYERLRDRNRRSHEEKLEEIAARLPGLRPLANRVASLEVQKTKLKLDHRQQEVMEIQQEIEVIREKYRAMLEEGGYTLQDLEPIYTCPDCKDTGYAGDGSEDGPRFKCHCLQEMESRMILEEIYDQSNLKAMLQRENFSVLTYDHLEGEDLTHFRKAVDTCHDFVQEFGWDYRNLLFCGTVGTGKSFLSCCIAGEVMKAGHSVLYLSSQRFFDLLGDNLYRSESRREKNKFLDTVYGCDLLILDDLGTEYTNDFVAVQLFALINERHVQNKSTIISTNLDLKELSKRYSERVFSRIVERYTVIKLTGPNYRML